MDTPVPAAAELTTEAYMGRACYACGRLLSYGAVYRGWAFGWQGRCRLDTEVWACPPA